MASLEKKNLYEPGIMKSLVDRVEKIEADSKPEWGDMNAAQMLAHCSEIQEVMNGKPIQKTPFLLKLLAGMIKKLIVNDQPYKKNMQTHPQYKMHGEHDFETEKQRFLEALEMFSELRENAPAHPLFGDLTDIERGWSMYKHHDHHMQQFGV